VHSYTHRRRTILHLGLAHFLFLRPLQNLHSFSCLQEPTHSSGAEHTKEDIRALLAIGDVNLFKTRGRSLSSKVDGSLVLIDKLMSHTLPIPGTLNVG